MHERKIARCAYAVSIMECVHKRLTMQTVSLCLSHLLTRFHYPSPISLCILFIFASLLWMPDWLRWGTVKWFAKYGEQPLTSVGLTHNWHSWVYPCRSTCTQSHARNPLSQPTSPKETSKPESMSIEAQSAGCVSDCCCPLTHRHTNTIVTGQLQTLLCISAVMDFPLCPGIQTPNADRMTGWIQG